ncbi:MAG: hypothetical protein LBB31_05490, partial [Prevotellaceae bacterium]|nr:hypothetical protein [Prevotellaceae bacterium]
WEAWIKDTRDSEYYRIVLMPDNKWWLAQNVKLASYGGSSVGAAISGCTKDECGRRYTCAQVYASSASTGTVQGICPSGWLLPIRATYNTLASAIGNMATVCASLRTYDSSCSPISDSYGWSSRVGICNGGKCPYPAWYTNDAGREDGFIIDINAATNTKICNNYVVNAVGENEYPVVRCFRQL